MALPGRKPKPYLQAVREGNPGHRRLNRGAVLTGELAEPDWSDVLPGSGEQLRARRIARELYRKLAPALARSAGLSGEMRSVLVDYCICVARIDQGERALSRRGVLVKVSDRNEWVKNPWTTVLHQYRAQFRSLIGELGLSPASASRITPGPDLDDDDDPFD
jgi:P27 family predicted phage terminase small subunit